MKKILIIGTGGTIACVKEKCIHLDTPFKILDYACREDVEFECISPFTILSENMDLKHIKMLIDFVGAVDFEQYEGVIILHGSDTLSFTASIIANSFYGKPIILTASNKPLEDSTANGVSNFNTAVDAILSGISNTYVSYDTLTKVKAVSSGKPAFEEKNILIISPYPSICYDNYKLDGVAAVVHTMYHSATAPQTVKAFTERCSRASVAFYFVTENSSADYESARDFENIVFNSTPEDVYARLLLNLPLN